MTSDDLTPAQAEQVRAVVTRELRYLGRLRDRMTRRGFPPDDPLMWRVEEAFDAVHALSVELHYLTCARGSVGRATDGRGR